MYLRILKKDIKRKKTMNVILLIFITLAAMFIASSVNNIISVMTALDNYYESAPDDIFRRHDNCDCVVTYECGRTRQDVWSKKSWEAPEVKNADYKPTVLNNEQAKALQAKNLRFKGIDNGGESGIIKSGAISGALNPDSERAQEHADRYYESVRHMTNDVHRIAENTGFDENEISEIKNFIFMEKHDLGGEELEYFYPNYEMSQSWQRLINGKNIQPHDITLLNHEIMEQQLLMQGYSQSEAHRITEQTYNYSKESKEYYANIDKHKKDK